MNQVQLALKPNSCVSALTFMSNNMVYLPNKYITQIKYLIACCNSMYITHCPATVCNEGFFPQQPNRQHPNIILSST